MLNEVAVLCASADNAGRNPAQASDDNYMSCAFHTFMLVAGEETVNLQVLKFPNDACAVPDQWNRGELAHEWRWQPFHPSVRSKAEVLAPSPTCAIRV